MLVRKISLYALTVVLLAFAGVGLMPTKVSTGSGFALEQGDWGDEYTNDKGQHICICDDQENDCRPCYST